jgi:uncharacterized protein (TIGR02757 family)|nr:MAG TPA: Protein of unknown function (DUF2400) [Bacteriophage sp.]
MRIYQIANPFFLSDMFIFGNIAEIGFCYIKINCRCQIEEIGVDIEKRMHNTHIEKIISQSQTATVKHRHLFTSISAEFWHKVLKDQRKSVNTNTYIDNNSGNTLIKQESKTITNDTIQQQLVKWANKYETSAFITDDPVQFPRKYIGKRAEISGFITSWISFGNRKAIIKAADWLDKDFCNDPYCWVMTKQYNFYHNNHRNFYRFLTYDDLYQLGNRLHRLYEDFERMEDMVAAWSDKTPIQALSLYFHDIKGIPDYDKGSACKRLCMFLRWMVRPGSPVDMGIWQKISPDSLIIPLDTHVHKMALELGLTNRKQADMKTAVEITNAMREIFPNDPIKGDFALFGYSVEHK